MFQTKQIVVISCYAQNKLPIKEKYPTEMNSLEMSFKVDSYKKQALKI